ncbi:uncharacterized protein TRAVEDRAFT_110639 [Trametes versicolor FP-101664 SS1]|uniref:uncharacterized protein n=1 Tax=Trametes versicolor (strain FP-101664) TaxID=717944 RepID=UPI000462246A|nr:uncharacterized protein TRAVEDRAFT_110639 [Trametes versicolor FP-101664 SS1]EIW64710.1 hypothetical protein TRAVEDRAFT_110639 [Trametes versicolor FP-101664 SS1]
MYSETLRRYPDSGHEEPAAKTDVPARGTSAPHPSPIVPTQGLLVLQPIMTVSRSSTHSSPASWRASHRRDAFEGYRTSSASAEARKRARNSPVFLR